MFLCGKAPNKLRVSWRNFQFTVESNSGLDLFYFNILLDWRKKKEDLNYPEIIKCETITDHDVVSSVSRASGSFLAFPLSCYYLVAVVITSVLFLYDTDLGWINSRLCMWLNWVKCRKEYALLDWFAWPKVRFVNEWRQLTDTSNEYLNLPF